MKNRMMTLSPWILAALLAVGSTTACIVVTEGDGDDWDEWGEGDDHWGEEHGDHWGDEDDHWGEDSTPSPCSAGAGACGDMGGDDTEQDMSDRGEDQGSDCPLTMDVCGEDGVTYPTPCDASRAHVHVAHEGACGVPCVFDDECGAYQSCGAQGVCEDFSCDQEPSAPVCGEDGTDYNNSCEALAHHVIVRHEGACLPACVQDTDCDLGSICGANGCELADCPDLPDGDHSQEVCGEDTFTYVTLCHARAAHIDVVHEGCCVE